MKKNIKIHLWDLAGQERFKSIVKTYYRNCNGILLLFDLTNKNSFENISYWYNDITNMYYLENDKQYNPSIFLIGNKNDINYKNVYPKDVEKMIENKIISNYMECSAKTGENIEDIFNMLNDTVYRNIKEHNHFDKLSKVSRGINIHNNKNNKNKNNKNNKYKCCYL